MIFHVDLPLPDLPQPLDGLRIVHLTDLHIRRRRKRFDEICSMLERETYDLAVLTGDYMTLPGDEDVATQVLAEVAQSLRPRLGSFGVFGNHDSQALRQMAMERVKVHWLADSAVSVPEHGLEIVGLDTHRFRGPDVLAMFAHRNDPARKRAQVQPHGASERETLQLMLCHKPEMLPTASDLGMDVMFSGHTHGGQWRLPGKIALKNCSTLPLRLTSGLLRHRNTLCGVSRGVGEVLCDWRFFCPPHVPMYVLRKGPRPGRDVAHIDNVQRW